MRETSVLRINSEFVAGEVIESEAVIINLGNGMIYTMDGVGARIWQMIEEGRSLNGISEALASEYSVPAAQALADIKGIARELLDEDLIAVDDAPSSSDPGIQSASGPAAAQPYSKPRLIKDAEMKDVLALDPPLPRLDGVKGRIKAR
jgi:hypothetical protein